MSITQVRAPELEPSSSTPVRPRVWRLVLLCLFLLLALGSTVFLRSIAPAPFGDGRQFVSFWFVSFVPYLVCCLFILRSKPQSGRWQWIELGIILLGALAMRMVLLPVLPFLSRDSWRYLWDARVTLHGYSPYVYVPDNPALVPLHDSFIYGHMDYHNVPSLYPPMAQAVYLLSYLIAPSNMLVLKAIFLGFDLVTCCILAFLLKRKGLDPARCLIYAWCPLPLVEFAIQGHIDAVMLAFLMLIVVCAMSTRRGMRVLVGFLLGLATLTKLYPIILLVVVMRRRDYALLLTCLLTILAGYVPYLILGHGHVLGFFSTYINQHGGNGGFVMLALLWIGKLVGLQPKALSSFEHGIDLLILCGMALVVLRLRLRERISMEAAILLLIGTIFSISSFVYPWYVTALLPWIALLLGPLWTRTAGTGLMNPQRGHGRASAFFTRKNSGRIKLHAKGIAVVAGWYFVCMSAIAYFFLGAFDWRLYYMLIDGVVCILLGIAAVVGSAELKKMIKNHLFTRSWGG